MIVLLFRSMGSKHLQRLSQLWIVRSKEPAIAGTAEVFGGIKAKASNRAKASCPSLTILRADCLCRILYNLKLKTAGNVVDRVEVRALTEQRSEERRVGKECKFGCSE